MAELNGMQGNEIADDFKRKISGQSRWKETWEIVKAHFWKLVALNLIVLIFFVPGIAVIYVRNIVIDMLGSQYPFNPTAGITALPANMLLGFAELIKLRKDVLFDSLLIAAGLIASIGISGATYCIRKLVQTRGEFHFKSFFHGIKVGYLPTVIPVTLFMIFLYGTFVVKDWMSYERTIGGNAGGAITAYVFIIIAIVMAGIYLAWIFAVGVSYRVKFKYLLRNSFTLILGTPIQTIFMGAFTLLPVWLVLLGGFWLIFGYLLFAFFGFSFMLISWLGFTQWAVDLYITPAVQAEKDKERAKKTDKELAEERVADTKRRALELLAAGRSELISHPIKPIDSENMITTLGKTFSRAQISEAADNREKLAMEIASYEKEHEKDDVYVEYNRMFSEREKALTEPEKKGKSKKKISSDNLLK